jgi:uncharacterized membrane protein YGL010W
MKSGVEQLTMYAAYHRDRRNIATHFVGVPLIVLGVVILLSRPTFFFLDGVAVTPALVGTFAAVIYYFVLDKWLATALTAFLVVCIWIGQLIAPMPTFYWLSWGFGVFLTGWAIQFVGHYYEQKKPAFVDDLIGLMIGPLFVAAELAFAIRLRQPLQAQIESVVGPTLIRAPKAA